jgi:hypothetical protein
MPFDPNLPSDGSPLSAAEMRAQLLSLQTEIQAIPVGPPGPTGPMGPQGLPFAGAQVDTTITLSPGNSAAVTAIFDGVNVRFSFQIPQGVAWEVSAVELSTAMSNLTFGSSASSNGVALLLPAIPAPSLLDVAQKLDELIQALRR